MIRSFGFDVVIINIPYGHRRLWTTTGACSKDDGVGAALRQYYKF